MKFNYNFLSLATTGLVSILTALPTSMANPANFEYTASSDYGFGSSWDLQAIIAPDKLLPDEDDIDYLGGLHFSPNGQSLCVVEDCEESDAGIYCLDVTRNPDDGSVVSLTSSSGLMPIQNASGVIATTYNELDLGFRTGPGGFEFISTLDDTIVLALWDYDAAGKPTQLNVKHVMDTEPLSTSYFVGLGFSNIVTDPNTGFGMMFVAGYDQIVAVPLIQDGFYYEIDYDNVQFLCQTGGFYAGDLSLISTGKFTDSFLTLNYDSMEILVLDIDRTTGYPVGYDPLNPLIYNRVEFNETGTSNGRVPMTCPFTTFMNVTTDPKIAEPWGLTFDGKTGDFFFSDYDGDRANLFRIRGFPPGFDPDVVGANIQAVFDEIAALINSDDAPARRERTLKRVESISSNDEARYTRSRKLSKKVKKEGNDSITPSCKSIKSTKKNQVTTNPCGIDEIEKRLSEGELTNSLVDANGDVAVSSELTGAIALIFDPDADGFKDAITGADGSSAVFTENVATMKNVLATVASLAPQAVQAEVDAWAAYGNCLLVKLENISNPLNAPDCVSPARR